MPIAPVERGCKLLHRKARNSRDNKCIVKPESADGPGNETIDTAAFDRLIKKPIQRCLTAVGKDKILYILLAYDENVLVIANPG
jgi:hypothetical protein